MYIRDAERDIIMQETPELERYSCMASGTVGAIQLCGGCAQAVATQLMKDVRCYESDQQVSVKVAATLRP